MVTKGIIKDDRKPLIGFLILWTILNVVQSLTTDLAHDEAYYWTWSKHLDWGFMEHPPMVAVFIRIGYALLQNELGVRLMAVLLSTLVLYLVYDRLVKKDAWLYIAMVSSILLFHAGGFMTAPDTPLFFFVALYYLLLKKYIEADDWRLTVGMILTVTAMMYSKYHAVLVLFFTILFNLKLLTRKSFWIIAFSSAILYVPHLYWLFTKGQPGLEYALSDRFYEPFSLDQIFHVYIGGQLAVMGPLIGFILVYATFAKTPANSYERALKYIVVGMLAYFLIWSFKGRVEANWTASALIPMVVLTHGFVTERAKLRKVVLWLAVPSLAFLLLARAQIAFRLFELPHVVDRYGEFHGWKDYGQRIKALAGDMPIVSDGYHNPPKMWFYSGNTAISLNLRDHPNQYLLWDYNEQFLDKSVMVISNSLMDGERIRDVKGETKYKAYEQFRSYREVKLTPDFTQDSYKAGDVITLDILVTPPPKWSILGKENAVNPTYITCSIQQNGEWVKWNEYHHLIEKDIDAETALPFRLPMPPKPGEYEFTFNLEVENLIIWHTTKPVSITVKD